MYVRRQSQSHLGMEWPLTHPCLIHCFPHLWFLNIKPILPLSKGRKDIIGHYESLRICPAWPWKLFLKFPVQAIKAFVHDVHLLNQRNVFMLAWVTWSHWEMKTGLHFSLANPLIGLTNQGPELLRKLLSQNNWTCKYLCCSYPFLSSFSVSIAFFLLEGICRRQNIISLLWLIMLQFIFNWDTYSWTDARQLNSY